MFTDNAFVTILLCSYLGAKEGDYKPYTALQWSRLVNKIVNSTLKEPSSLMKMSQEEIFKELKVDFTESNRIKKLLSRGGNMAFALEELERKGIKIVTRSDNNYPVRLKSILKQHAPALLYYCGDISLANNKGIAIVGSRNIDKKGENFARDLATKATKEGLAIYSGGARGIDTISEKAALDNGGRVISVLADSLVKKIKRKEYRDKIIQGKLLLLTANNPDAPFTAGGAMNRNKYVYVLSKGAFIVASDYNKGGTWAGATENLKNGWVKTFAFKSNSYAGNSVLIRKGAKPVDDLKNISINELIDEEELKSEQLDIFDVNKLNVNEDKILLVKESQNVIEYSNKNNEEIDFDLYHRVIDVIRKFLKEPKTLNEVSESLKINKKQASVWLNRAIENNEVKKLTRPARYVASE